MPRSSILGLMFAVLAGLSSFGCAATLPGDDILAQIRAERDHCRKLDPRGSARCWFDLAVRTSAIGDATLDLESVSLPMKKYGLTFEDIGVTAEDVDNVRRQGHFQEAKRAFDSLQRFAPKHEVSMYAQIFFEHITAASVPPRAIEPGLTFETIRSLERLGDLSEARKSLAIAREKPHTHAANAGIANIRRLLRRSGQNISDVEYGLTEDALDALR